MSLFRRKQDEVPTLQPGGRWISVMGTFAYPDAVKAAVRKHESGEAIAFLVTEESGQYKGAVSVFIDGKQVGHLPKEVAPDFVPIIRDLDKKRKRATVLVSLGDGDRIEVRAIPAENQSGEGVPAEARANVHEAPVVPVEAIPPKDFKSIATFASDPSWMQWPTLLEKHTSTVPLYGGHKGPKVPGIIKKYGHLVTVRFQVEPKGRSAGAIQCWVGSTMICVADNLDKKAFQAVIGSLAEDGQPATCRGTLEHLDRFDAFSVFGKPERRPEDAPFLPPEEVASVDVPDEELQRLDELLHSKAKTKVVHRVGTLVNHFGGTWLSLDGVWTGLVDDEPRACVDQAVTAGFPATCSVVLRRQPYEPLAVTVEIPKSV
jgi:hypothetical protein